MNQRPRVLVIAEAANPEWVSVPLVGWSLATALRAQADVHIVTQIRNREAFLRAGLVEGTDFTAIDSEPVARPMHRLAQVLRMGAGKGWTMTTAINAIAYPYFERLVWQRFGADLRAGRYDIVHRVTPLSPTIGSTLAKKCKNAGVPFMLGPLNGGVPWPAGFDGERRREREWLSYVRNAYRLQPGRAAMFAATRAILVGSRHTETEIPAEHSARTIYLPENAIDPARFSQVAAQSLDGPLRGCFVGRLVPYKGPDMLLEAAADLLGAGRLVLDIVGDGPLRAELEALAIRLGVQEKVTFHGNLPHAQVQDVLAQANLLPFPSIREFGGGVVLEAMSLGVVPVVVDYAGPGELVTPETGYRVTVGNRAAVIAGFSKTLAEIAADPADLPVLGQAARDRVQDFFTWEAKAAQVARVYDWVLAGEGPAPGLIPG